MQERIAMETIMDDPSTLSRLELISLYIDRYYSLDAELRSRFEDEFKKRKLPLPKMPQAPPAPRRRSTIDRGCLLSYILLIYTGTAIFYSWIYLVLRLLKMDFKENMKHKLIQSAIALFYVVAEVLLFEYFAFSD
jgi:hypothetical protein